MGTMVARGMLQAETIITQQHNTDESICQAVLSSIVFMSNRRAQKGHHYVYSKPSYCLRSFVVLFEATHRIVWGETKHCLKSNNEAFHLPLHTLYTINNKKKRKNTEKYMAKVCVYQIKSVPLHRFSLWEGMRII